MNKDTNSLINSAIKLFASGSGAIVGTSVGVTLTSLIGPNGAVVGLATGAALKTGIEMLLGEYASKQLSERQMGRVGLGLILANAYINENIEKGKSFRDDDFFEHHSSHTRSFSEEALEGILNRIKDSHEEKIAPYIARLYSNICFDKSISIGTANQMIQLFNILTFRQICILGYMKNKISLMNSLNNLEINLNKKINYDELSIKQEAFQLVQFGLLIKNIDSDPNPTNLEDEAILDSSQIDLSLMNLSELGLKYYTLMALDNIPQHEYKIFHRL